MKPSAHSVQALHLALFFPSSLSCQGAEEGQPVSYCETGSKGSYPIQVQLCLFSCCPRRKVVLLPSVSEDIARFLYTSGTGKTVSRACLCLLKMKAHRMVTGFQEVALRGYGRARFPTSTSSRSFWQPLSQSGAITMSLRARREMRVEARQAGMQSPRH